MKSMKPHKRPGTTARRERRDLALENLQEQLAAFEKSHPDPAKWSDKNRQWQTRVVAEMHALGRRLGMTIPKA